MNDGTLNQPVRITHPSAPSSGRHLRYVFDDGTKIEPYYMGDDGIPKRIVPESDHNNLLNIGTNTHAQIDDHIASTSNPHSTSYNDLLDKPNFYRWVLQSGNSNLPSNGTESSFTYGNNSANDGITAISNGTIEGMSVRLEPERTDGTAFYFVTINNINNNVAGQRVLIDGTTNSEGGIDGLSGALIFPTPIPYNKGDQIEVRAITSGWSPTSSDSNVLLRMKENLI